MQNTALNKVITHVGITKYRSQNSAGAATGGEYRRPRNEGPRGKAQGGDGTQPRRERGKRTGARREASRATHGKGRKVFALARRR